jgi:hypothetical protein
LLQHRLDVGQRPVGLSALLKDPRPEQPGRLVAGGEIDRPIDVGERPLAISGATGEGVRAMLEAAWKLAGK